MRSSLLIVYGTDADRKLIIISQSFPADGKGRKAQIPPEHPAIITQKNIATRLHCLKGCGIGGSTVIGSGHANVLILQHVRRVINLVFYFRKRLRIVIFSFLLHHE
jgi:hypothetical protein